METKVYHLKCGDSIPSPASTKRKLYGPSIVTLVFGDDGGTHGSIKDWPGGVCADLECEVCQPIREKATIRKALRKTQATIKRTAAAKVRKANTARKRNLRKARKAKASTKMHVLNVPGIGPVGFSVPTDDEGAR